MIFSLYIGNDTDAAGIVFIRRIIQALRARQIAHFFIHT